MALSSHDRDALIVPFSSRTGVGSGGHCIYIVCYVIYKYIYIHIYIYIYIYIYIPALSPLAEPGELGSSLRGRSSRSPLPRLCMNISLLLPLVLLSLSSLSLLLLVLVLVLVVVVVVVVGILSSRAETEDGRRNLLPGIPQHTKLKLALGMRCPNRKYGFLSREPPAHPCEGICKRGGSLQLPGPAEWVTEEWLEKLAHEHGTDRHDQSHHEQGPCEHLRQQKHQMLPSLARKQPAKPMCSGSLELMTRARVKSPGRDVPLTGISGARQAGNRTAQDFRFFDASQGCGG